MESHGKYSRKARSRSVVRMLDSGTRLLTSTFQAKFYGAIKITYTSTYTHCAKTERFSQLQRNPTNIRNLCIMAHVDHGKTTLADALIASNGIISQKLAGKLRYMDSREDEQQRGITMKSSAIALYHRRDGQDYLINLIDSPGHVDFTSEVSTAVRLCDGAIVLVDVVEGVCAQTKVSLKQAWIEGLKPVLILNKMDRLIVEQKKSPSDAYVHLQQILEQVNAVVGELFATDILSKTSKEYDRGGIANERGGSVSVSVSVGDEVYDWSSGLDETDDSNVYFSPDRGNVAFACALDGWGFGISHFAQMYTEKLGIKESVLLKTLWGDYYLNAKTKRIVKGAQARCKKPLFVQFILENVWSVYEAVVERRDPGMIEKIISSLNLEIKPRDLKCSDSRMLLQLICSQWLPLSKSTLDMVCEKLPSPLQISAERCEKLMCGNIRRFDSLPIETQRLKQHFVACSSGEEVPTIVFVSKMFTADSRDLPKFKQKPLTIREIMERREKSKQKNPKLAVQERGDIDKGDVAKVSEEHEQRVCDLPEDEDLPIFIAFARVFSGCLRKGQRVYVLGPKHKPEVALENLSKGMSINEALTLKDLKSDQHITSFEVSDLYLLMGRQLELLDQVPAGNIVGIGQLEQHALKSATLSSTLACPSFTDLHVQSPPIVRVALEPRHTVDMAALVSGLRLLNQADAAVRVQIQETGEHVIVTTGEVHLQRCLDDLQKSFAKVEIKASKPIVPFRETIVAPPKLDMTNEMIETIDGRAKNNEDEDERGVVSMQTANKACTLKLRAVPLPNAVTKLLEDNARVLEEAADGEKASTEAVHLLRVNLQKAFDEAGDEWKNATEELWAFGPRRQGPNVLLNRDRDRDRDHRQPSVWRRETHLDSSFLRKWEGSLTGGFQLATLAGPLCEEPMRGVCIVFERCEYERCDDEATSGDPYGPFSGQLMSAMKEGCRRAFQAQPQRLMTAMYTCNVLVTTEMLGKLYAVLGKRSGQVLASDLVEGSQMFDVTATLPVVESFDFANEIRKQTSGHAMPQLVFTHWQVVDIDPFWVPSTDREYAHFGEKADSENRARKYVNAVRRRKGLAVDEQVVQHAEKQRTLTRNKLGIGIRKRTLQSFFTFPSLANKSGKKVVCYYGSWAVYRPGAGKFPVEAIDPFVCTHLIYGFAGLSVANTIRSLDEWNDFPDNWGKDAFGRFNRLKLVNPELKTILAVGGWNEGSKKYSIMAESASTRKTFVNSVVVFLTKWGFDGLDMDWEYPNLRDGGLHDKENFVLLLADLKQAFAPHKFLLTSAVGAGKTTTDASYDIPRVSEYLDFINIMTYDYHGGWESVTGHNSPLYERADDLDENRILNMNFSIHHWIANGAPPEKLILGMGLYGRSFTLQNADVNGLEAPAPSKGNAGAYTGEAGTLGYNEICEQIANGEPWKIVWVDGYEAPYAYKGRQWVSYDDRKSIQIKANYARDMKLGGGMVWSIETDDFNGYCHGNKFPLISIIHETLRGPIVRPPAPSTTRGPTGRPNVSTSANLPSESDDCAVEGWFRDPDDCTIYWRCYKHGGRLVKQ
uniref:Ribosome assembly protein 1 n=1 Tax=Strigamia maritima TaxID=126957 RepID=T1JFT1_STRMM